MATKPAVPVGMINQPTGQVQDPTLFVPKEERQRFTCWSAMTMSRRKRAVVHLIVLIVVAIIVVIIWLVQSHHNSSESGSNSYGDLTCQSVTIDDFSGFTTSQTNGLGLLASDDNTLLNVTYTNRGVYFIPTRNGHFSEQISDPSVCLSALPTVRYVIFTMNGTDGSTANFQVQTKCGVSSQVAGVHFNLTRQEKTYSVDLKTYLPADAFASMYLTALVWTGFSSPSVGKNFTLSKPWLLKSVYAVNDLRLCSISAIAI